MVIKLIIQMEKPRPPQEETNQDKQPTSRPQVGKEGMQSFDVGALLEERMAAEKVRHQPLEVK